MAQNIIIGIDGGGSKTRMKVSDGRQILADISGGASNLNRVSESEVFASLQFLAQNSGVGTDSVSAVCMGAAGASSPLLSQKLTAMLSRLFPNAEITVVSDLVAAYSGGIYMGNEVVMIAGTGSVAVGINANGDWIRVGGWGYLLGDEGSGYDIGRQVLQSVLQSYDKRMEETCLTELVCKKFSIDSPAELVREIYENKVSPATVAPLCDEGYQRGDSVATRIVKKAANDLFCLYKAVCLQLHSDDVPDCILMGGIGENMKSLRKELSVLLEEAGSKILLPNQDAASGCLLLAQESLDK